MTPYSKASFVNEIEFPIKIRPNIGVNLSRAQLDEKQKKQNKKERKKISRYTVVFIGLWLAY